MILKFELNIRPKGLKRIEEKLCSISQDEDVMSLKVSNKMTGKSLLWKVKGEERKRMLSYYKKLGSGLLILGGAFLLLEHLFHFEGFDIELFGHEYYGLIFIALGFLLRVKWKQLPSFLKAIKNREWIKVLDERER